MEETTASHEEAQEAREEKETLQTDEVETPSQPEKVEQSKDLQSAIAQKEHFRSKLEKAEADKVALETRLKGFSSQPTGSPMEAVRLGKALAEHSEEEADMVITYAKGKFDTLTPTPEQIIQASKDDWVATAISANREKVAGENKTPEPSSPASTIGGLNSEDVEKLDTKAFAKLVRKGMEGGTGI